MALMPKRVKRRKQQRGRMKGRAHKGNVIAYGDYALVATECGWVKSNEIEAARVAMTRFIKRGGQVWIDIFPHKPITKKPAETRMGSGKGTPEFWVAVVKPDRVLFEMAGVTLDIAKEAMKLAGNKLSVTTKFMTKKDFGELVGKGNDSEHLKFTPMKEEPEAPKAAAPAPAAAEPAKADAKTDAKKTDAKADKKEGAKK